MIRRFFIAAGLLWGLITSSIFFTHPNPNSDFLPIVLEVGFLFALAYLMPWVFTGSRRP